MYLRQLTFSLITIAIIAILYPNLFPFRHRRISGVRNCDTLTPPPETESDPLRRLPQTEQDLHKKVLKTNYRAIWMGSPEVNLVLRYIHGKQNYLEWGSGGSTLNFPRWVKKAVSIEHDQGWCSQMKAKLAGINSLRHVDYRCVPVQKGTGGWGLESPFEEGTYQVFRKYIDDIGNTNIELFDFVLIDGRARVDCAIKALSYINNDSVVVLHDSSRVWDNGTYQDVLHYYDFLDYVDGSEKQGVAIMKRKMEFQRLQGDHQSVQQILDQKYPTANRTMPLNTETEKARLGLSRINKT